MGRFRNRRMPYEMSESMAAEEAALMEDVSLADITQAPELLILPQQKRFLRNLMASPFSGIQWTEPISRQSELDWTERPTRKIR